MKVLNITNAKGRAVPNQFILEMEEGGRKAVYFQSYDSIIAKKIHDNTILDINYWDYSTTTGKYRNQFLNETKKETERKIKGGEYILDDLNAGKVVYHKGAQWVDCATMRQFEKDGHCLKCGIIER